MELKDLFEAIAFSPDALLTKDIGASDTIIYVDNASAFPKGPGLATIGVDEGAETIKYGTVTENALSGCERGIEGTAKAWTAGEKIARNFTAKDWNDLIANLKTIVEGIEALTAGDVGAIPVINAEGSSFNMTEILKSGPHLAIYKTDTNTIDTPNDVGLSSLSKAAILSYSGGNGYGFQISFPSGGRIPHMRRLNNGTVYDWGNGFVASDFNAIETYTSLDQLGLTDDDFVADDFNANVYKVISSLPTCGQLIIRGSTNTFCMSLKAKINADCKRNLVESSVIAIKLTKFGTNATPSKIEVVHDSASTKAIWTSRIDGANSASVCDKFIEMYNEAGFVTSNGSKPMTDVLRIEKASFPAVSLDDTTTGTRATVMNEGQSASLMCQNVAGDTSNYRKLYVRNSAGNYPELVNAIEISDVIDGHLDIYTMFGTHNKPDGSYTGNGSATEREIDIGGLDGEHKALLIGSVNGFAMVFGIYGSVVKNVDVLRGLKSTEAQTTSAQKLKLKTTDACLNQTGVEYYYKNM